MDAGGRATPGAVAEAEQKKVLRRRVREPDEKNVAIATQHDYFFAEETTCVTSVINLQEQPKPQPDFLPHIFAAQIGPLWAHSLSG